MSDTKLTLGSFQFSGFEIPAQIAGIGSSQSLSIHRLVGGDRVIDAMGKDYRPLEWSGLFFGSDATDRFKALRDIASAGLPLTLTWHSFSYQVMVRDVSGSERQQFEIPYSISCEVLADNSSPADTLTSVTTDFAIQQGMSAAQIQAALIDDEGLTAQIGILAAVIQAVDTFASAEASILASVLQPLTATRNIVNALLGTSDAEVGEAGGFGGVVAGTDALTMALALDVTEAAVFQELELLELAGILGVMYANLTAVNGSPNTLATAGGNLFAISAAAYGDVDAWTAIATANNLTDPFIQGTTTLTIPLSPKDTGGVLTN